MLRGTAYLTASQFFFVIANLALHAYLGRALGPDLYGIFGIIVAFLFINELILFKGVYASVSRFVAQQEESAAAIIRSALNVLAIISIIAGAAYFFFAKQLAVLLHDPELAVYIKLSAFIIPLMGVSTVFVSGLNGLRQFGRQASVLIVYDVVRLAAVCTFVFSGYSVKGAVAGILFADLLKLIMARILLRPPGESADFDGSGMLHFTLQLVAMAVLTALVMNIDLFAVKVFMKDNVQTGLYTAAVTVAKIPLILMFPVSLTIFPTISKSLSEGDMVRTERYIQQAIKLLIMFVFPVAIIFAATSENFISLFYGNRYVNAAAPLKILIFGMVLFSFKVLMYNIIMASGYPGLIIYISLASLLMDVILLNALVGRIGLKGAALASTVTHLLGVVIACQYVMRKFISRLVPIPFIRIAIASSAVYLAARLYSPHGIALLFYDILLLCAFFMLLILMKVINMSELKMKLG